MQLDLPLQSLTKEDLRWEDIQDNRISTYQNAQPQILLGLDNIRATAISTSYLGHNLQVTLTPLGWAAEGVVGLPKEHSAPKPLQSIQMSDLHHLIERFIDNDNLGIDPKRPILESEEIKRAREQLERGINKLQVGYEMGLLWLTQERPQFSNREAALSRLFKFQKTMNESPGLREEADEIIRKYEEKNYISRIRRLDNELEWYLPVFAVQSATKTRLVFDAAANYKGLSLNKMLSKGPDLNEPLWNILYRFRQNPVAVCSDVSEMFHRIKVREEDKRYQRFAWISKYGRVVDYEMNVQTFGAACSPSIAQFVKNENARQYSQEFPAAVEAITSDTYVDDLVTSFRTEAEAIMVLKEVVMIHANADFHLHKWQSNSSLVMQIYGEPHAPKTKQLQKHPKALGIAWDTERDMLYFDFEKVTQTFADLLPTKREMLSLIMSLFDPLGLVAHLAIIGRLLLRETWKIDCDWDDQVPDSLATG